MSGAARKPRQRCGLIDWTGHVFDCQNHDFPLGTARRAASVGGHRSGDRRVAARRGSRTLERAGPSGDDRRSDDLQDALDTNSNLDRASVWIGGFVVRRDGPAGDGNIAGDRCNGEPILSDRVGGLPVGLGDDSLRQQLAAQGLSVCLRTVQHSPFLLHDRGIDRGGLGSPATCPPLGLIPELARFLRPFAAADLDATAAAGALIARFGTPARALCASDGALHETLPGQTIANAIVAARALVDFAHSTVVANELLDPASPPFARYLTATLGPEEHEVLLAIFLDAEGRYLADERIGGGDFHSIEVRMRPLAARAIELGANGLLLAHNHPSGNPQPSALDRQATNRIAEIMGHIEVNLVDHLVVGRQGVFSIARNALIWER